jgi:hypothetical protein
MSPPEATIERESWSPDTASDLSSLLANLSVRLHQPNIQERWYPGSSAIFSNVAALPYYRVPEASSISELLEAALVRPAGVRLDLDDWLEAFEAQRSATRSRAEAKSVARNLRVAFAGGIAGGVLAIGAGLVSLTLLNDAYKPNPYLSFSIGLGGIFLTISVGVAIIERRWRASR